MVYGGQISFSLYMVHEIVHTTWNWAVIEYTIEMPKSTAKLVVVGLLLAALGAAMLLYHFVEEPARRWMRRMVDFRDVKTSDSTASDVRSADLKAGDLDTDGLKNGNVQAIGPVRESRGSARAV
jgi:peptidoglycan/LPS O-acetylase OafA/YrhL